MNIPDSVYFESDLFQNKTRYKFKLMFKQVFSYEKQSIVAVLKQSCTAKISRSIYLFILFIYFL